MSKLSIENISNTSNGLENFLQICIGVLDKLAPQKKKYNRSNSIPYLNKPLPRVHMKRTRLRNRFLKNRSEVNRINFIKQRNYYIKSFEKNQKTTCKFKMKKTFLIITNSGRLVNLFFLTNLNQMKKSH